MNIQICYIKKNRFTFILVLLCLMIHPFFMRRAIASLNIPSDPYSAEAFNQIKDYYNIKNGLPLYRVKNIQSQEEFSVDIQTIRIGVEGFPDVVLVIKTPKNMMKPLPAIILFSGFQTGAQSIKLIQNPDSYIVVGFEYPWPIDFLSDSLKWDWKRMEVIPILMAVAISWLQNQPYIDVKRVNVISVSFGTIFYPLAQRILNESGRSPHSTVFGYGGVDISSVIGEALKIHLGQPELLITKLMIHAKTWFIEPKYHLSHLKGPFLVVHGAEDSVFPENSKQELANGLLDPKKIITLPGGHIQPDRPDIIDRFMKEVFTFLKSIDSI